MRPLFIAATALATALAACATTSGVARSPGADLVRRKCAACHLRPAPDRFDRAGWERVLDVHAERAPLSAQERAAVLEHLAPSTTPPATSSRQETTGGES